MRISFITTEKRPTRALYYYQKPHIYNHTYTATHPLHTTRVARLFVLIIIIITTTTTTTLIIIIIIIIITTIIIMF